MRAIDALLGRRAITYRAALVIAVIGGLVVALLLWVLSYLTSIDIEATVPVWAAGVIALLLGTFAFATGTFLGRRLYKPDVARAEAQTAQLLAQLELERKAIGELKPHREAYRRLDIYTEHLHRLIEQIIDGHIALTGFPDALSQETTRAFLSLPRANLKEAAGIDAYFSIWVERRLPKWTPEPIGRRFEQFQIAFAPDHTQAECEAFAVRIDQAYLDHASRQRSVRDRLLGVNDLEASGLYGPDLDAFRTNDYGSLRATGFESRDGRAFLVVLARGVRAFSRLEDRYILLLSLALQIAAKVAVATPSEAES